MTRDFAQRLNETHVHHLVGLIEDKHLHLVEPDCLAVQQVDQAAGCGDQYVPALDH